MIRPCFLLAIVLASTHLAHADDIKLLQIPPIKDGTRSFTVLATVPQTVLDAIRNTPPLPGGKDSLAGYRQLDQQILKVDQLTINALSNTRFRITAMPPQHPFYVIAARNIFIEIPKDRRDAAQIGFRLDTPSLHGNIGAPGIRGRSWGIDWTDQDGTHGGEGGPGYPGGNGGTLDLPPIYIVFQNIIVSSGTPNTSLALSFDLNGVPGGNGGRGGAGGQGGNGARGIAAGCSSIGLGICTCDRGPGIGGDAGKPGPGGRGGDAGRGGNGGDITFVGPRGTNDTNFNIINSFLQVTQAPAPPGSVGNPGDPGASGIPGGGGETCPCCNGRGPGAPSPAANPHNLGPGAPANLGIQGSQSVVVRDNSDLF